MKKIVKILFAVSVTALIYMCGAALTASADSSLIIQTSPSVTAITPRLTTDFSDYISTTVSTTISTTVSSSTNNSDSSDVSSDTTVSSSSLTTSTTVSSTQVSGEIVKGWNRINKKWYYFNGQKFLTGLQKIDGEPYVFAPNGALRTGWQTVKSARRYYDPETHTPMYGWVTFLENKYYIDHEKGKYVGMQQIDDATYIFDNTGIMQTGCTLYNDFMYCCGSDGKVIYGDNSKTPVKVGDTYYYISPKGYVMRGWQTINGIRTFYDYDTGQPVYGWVEYQGHCYYNDEKKGKYTGDQYIDSYPYRFSESGILETGLQYFETSDVTSYFYEDGKRAVSEIVKSPDGQFYFDDDGYMVKGFFNFDNDTYYSDNDGKLLFGFQVIGKNKYYFDEDGKMQTGLISLGNVKYYFDENGIMQYGFQTINGKKYYFDIKTGIMARGFKTIGKDKYYFNSNGIMQTGLVTVGKSRYYFDKNGIMQYGFQTISNKKYYFDTKTGACFKGFYTISNKKYYFDDMGVMATGKYSVGEDTYYFGNDGIMRTGWQTIGNDKFYFGSNGKMYTYRHKIDNIDYLFYSTGVLVSGGNQNIVLKALSQLGQTGGRPYWTWWGFNYRIEWCACFVSWCAASCGYTNNGNVPEFISCKVGIDWFKAHGQWKGKNYIPKSGDYIFFDWEPDAVADHIGIVDYYEDGYVYTVEGNSGDKVRKKIYDIKSKEIYGFAAPNF